MRSAFAALWVVAGCALAALAAWLAFAPADVERIVGETGPVEILTAATYALCAAAIWWARGRTDDFHIVAASSVVMLAFCLRGLDWHKQLTGTSVLLAALGWFVLRHAREVWQGWRERQPMAITLGAFLVTLVLAKTLDRSVGILVGDYGVDVPLIWKALRTAFEEWFELGLSMLVMLALLQHRAARSNR